MWSLESQDLLTEIQCGFSKNRSTLDHRVRFETFIRDAFVQKQHDLAIFFDLEKAYDTTWKHAILSEIWDLDFRGHLPIFTDEFLSERLFKVRVGPTLSELHQQEMGVPQGSILSPALFSIKFNSIVKSVVMTPCLWTILPYVFGAGRYKEWRELCNYVSTVFKIGSPKMASSFYPLKQHVYILVDRTYYPTGQISYQSCQRSNIPWSDFWLQTYL